TLLQCAIATGTWLPVASLPLLSGRSRLVFDASTGALTIVETTQCVPPGLRTRIWRLSANAWILLHDHPFAFPLLAPPAFPLGPIACAANSGQLVSTPSTFPAGDAAWSQVDSFPESSLHPLISCIGGPPFCVWAAVFDDLFADTVRGRVLAIADGLHEL